MKTLVTGFCLFGIVLSLCFGCTNSSSGKGDLIVVDTKANFLKRRFAFRILQMFLIFLFIYPTQLWF